MVTPINLLRSNNQDTPRKTRAPPRSGCQSGPARRHDQETSSPLSLTPSSSFYHALCQVSDNRHSYRDTKQTSRNRTNLYIVISSNRDTQAPRRTVNQTRDRAAQSLPGFTRADLRLDKLYFCPTFDPHNTPPTSASPDQYKQA